MSKNEIKTKEFKADFGTRLFQAVLSLGIKAAAGILFGQRIRTDKTVKAWKKSGEGLVILCAHPSEFDAVLLLSSVFPRYTRFVAGEQQLYKGLQGKILRKLKVIPKKQFVSDIRSVKEMLNTVRKGYILAMMPEGRVSPDGTPNPIDISTAKLIKKLGVNVAGMIPKGTYFVKPSFDYKGIKRGPVSADVTPLLTAEETRTLTPEAILEKLSAGLAYDESEALRGTGSTYKTGKAPAMDHVSGLFYLCPCCQKLYTVSDENGTVRCEACGASAKLLPTMFLDGDFPDTVSGWNRIQKDHEKAFWQDPDAFLELPVSKYVLDLDAMKEACAAGTDVPDYSFSGKGLLRLDAQAFHYKDETEEITVPLGALPGVSADYMQGFIVQYEGNLIRRFVFDDGRNTLRFVNSLMELKSKE